MPDYPIPFMKCGDPTESCMLKADWQLQAQPPAYPKVDDDDLATMFACDHHLDAVIRGFTGYLGLGAILVWPYEIGE